jgi:hypothetical protein
MLNPGDKVIELAGVVISSAVTSGAISAAVIVWLIKKNWLPSTGAFFVGALFGFLVAQVMARLFYRSDGNTVVAKLGVESLSLTIPAGLAGGITTALLVALVSILVFNASSQIVTVFGVALGCGIALGVLMACLGSLS